MTFSWPPPAGRSRVLGAAIAAGLVILVLFTVFVLRLTENAVRREATGRVGTTAELSARLVREQALRIGEVVGSYGSRLATLTPPRDAHLPTADRRRLQLTLQALRTEVDGIASASFADPQGRLVAASPAPALPIGTDLSGRDWYQGVKRRSPYLSRAFISAAKAHRKVTVTAVRVYGTRHRLLGILLASETDRTQRFTDAFGREFHANVTVTDQDGVIVGTTGGAANRLVSLAQDPLVGKALKGRKGTSVGDVDGDRTVTGYAPVMGVGWTVTAAVPASEAYADIPRLRVALLAAAGVIAFLLLWLVPTVAGRLSRARDALGVQEAFQRDLLPSQLPHGVQSVYRASERRMLLGGDFIDAVATPQGGVALLVGDVCGHGPRAAALGASLRAGWRTLATAGVGTTRLDLLDLLVEGERRDEDLFVTVACAEISPDGRHLTYALAGHPPPLLLTPDGITALEGPRGAALGLGASVPWPTGECALPDGWALALYTDGLIEARETEHGPRLGVPGLIGWATDPAGRPSAERLLRAARDLADREGRALEDDLALVLVDASVVQLDVRTSAAPRSIEHA